MQTVGYFLFFAVLTVCYSQAPPPCESPKQWHGQRYTIDRSHHYMYTDQSYIFYDETNMRIREDHTIEHEKENWDTIISLLLFKTKKAYRVSQNTRQCNVTTIDYPFPAVGVPKDATFQFEAELGLASVAKEHFTSVTYNGSYVGKNTIRYSFTVTQPGCVPVADSYNTFYTGTVQNRYFNVHLGMKDPDVFDIPQACQ